MKLTLSPTDAFETVNGTPARIWEGVDEAGTPVKAWIAVVQPQTDDLRLRAAFNAALKALPHAKREVVAFDLRYVL